MKFMSDCEKTLKEVDKSLELIVCLVALSSRTINSDGNTNTRTTYGTASCNTETNSNCSYAYTCQGASAIAVTKMLGDSFDWWGN